MKAYQLSGLTIEEYIQQEQESGVKYEYHNGRIFALAGGSINHGLLCGNIYSELRNGLRTKSGNCKPVTSELKLSVESQNSFVYPDTMVVCGDIQPSDRDQHAITNPVLIAEVLSKSTADYDRGDKFFLYRQIPTLQEYVLIEQDKYVIEVYYKKPETDLWQISRVTGLENTLELQSIGIQIKLADLYFDIDLSEK